MSLGVAGAASNEDDNFISADKLLMESQSADGNGNGMLLDRKSKTIVDQD